MNPVYYIGQCPTLWNKTFAQKIDKGVEEKTQKQRLTISFVQIWRVISKTPWNIGKSKNLPRFKASHVNKLLLEWVSNKKAWTRTEVRDHGWRNVMKKRKKQNRKVLLFLDNAKSHPKLKLGNVGIVFFPLNTTSLC